MSNTTSRALLISSVCSFAATVALAQPVAAAPADQAPSLSSTAVPPTTPTPADRAAPTVPSTASTTDGYRLGAHAEIDLGILAFLKQGTATAGGVTYDPFRAGLSYSTFLSNPSALEATAGELVNGHHRTGRARGASGPGGGPPRGHDDCWDNAVAESFFAILRAELVDHERYAARYEAKLSIGDYIDNFYNVERRWGWTCAWSARRAGA